MKRIFPLLIITLVGLAVYSNTFRGEFIFDDRPRIAENPVIRSLGNFLPGGPGYSYNPQRVLCNITFALNYRLGVLDVKGYHIFNLVIHLINALLVYSLVCLTFRTPRMIDSKLGSSAGGIALFSALLFVVHPLQTQAVTYIVQRYTSLMALFYLASIVLYAKWRLSEGEGNLRRGRPNVHYLLSLTCIVLAMKTKENAFLLPVSVFIYDLIFFRMTILKKPFYLVPILLTIWIIPASLLDVNKSVGDILGDVGRATAVKATVSRWEYLVTQFSVVSTYIRLLVLPIQQNLDYDYPISRSLFTFRAMTSFLFLLSLFGLAVLLLRKSHKKQETGGAIISFGILWFFVTLAVESSLIPITDVIYEHRVYLPAVGAFIALAAGVAMILDRINLQLRGNLPIALAIGVVLVLGTATYRRNAVWANGVRLWTDVVEKSPRKARGYNSLGASLADAGRLDEAIAVLNRGIAIQPNYADAYYNLGRIYLILGYFAEAIDNYNQALRLSPDHVLAHVNLGRALANQGRGGEAISHYEIALALDSSLADAHLNLGILLVKTGEFEKALQHYEAALRLEPYSTKAPINMGTALAQKGKLDEAASLFGQALRIDPASVESHFNLGVILTRQMRVEEAAHHFSEVLRLKPDTDAARRWMEVLERERKGLSRE